jgi:hypothetical protein
MESNGKWTISRNLVDGLFEIHLSGFSMRAWEREEVRSPSSGCLGGLWSRSANCYTVALWRLGCCSGSLRGVVSRQTGDPARTCLLRDNQHSDLQPGTECKHTVAATQCTGTTRCLLNTGRFKITDLTASTDPETCDVMRADVFFYFIILYQMLSLYLSNEIW